MSFKSMVKVLPFAMPIKQFNYKSSQYPLDHDLENDNGVIDNGYYD